MRLRTAQLALPFAFLVLTFSTGATLLAVMVTVGNQRGASWAVPLVVLCISVPQIVLAPLAAPLFDKIGARRLILYSVSVQVTVLVIGAAMHSLLVIIVMITLKSAASALDGAAFLLLVERANRGDGGASGESAAAFARLDTARLIGGLIGPVLGGAMMQFFSVSWVFIIDAAAIALCGVIVLFIRNPDINEEAVAPTSWWHRVKGAPALLFKNSATRAALVGLAAAIIFTSFYSVAEVLFALKTLKLNPLEYGILSQCFIVGRLFGAQIGGRTRSASAPRWLLLATALMGIGLLVPGVIHTVIAAGIGFLVAGFANAIQVAAIRLVVVGAVPDSARGRSLSTMGSINQSAGVIGTAVAAPVLAFLGPAGTLVVAGLGTLAAAGTTTVLRSRRPVPVEADA